MTSPFAFDTVDRAADSEDKFASYVTTGRHGFDLSYQYTAPFPEDDRLAQLQPDMQSHLKAVGRCDGPFKTPEGRRREYEFWISTGEVGARWLAGQSGSLSRQWGIADILSAMGSATIGATLDALASDPEDDQADALLSALANMPPTAVVEVQDRVSQTVRHYLSHADDAVRSQAVAATAVLAADEAANLLRRRLQGELHEDVQAAIADELGRRQ